MSDVVALLVEDPRKRKHEGHGRLPQAKFQAIASAGAGDDSTSKKKNTQCPVKNRRKIVTAKAPKAIEKEQTKTRRIIKAVRPTVSMMKKKLDPPTTDNSPIATHRGEREASSSSSSSSSSKSTLPSPSPSPQRCRDKDVYTASNSKFDKAGKSGKDLKKKMMMTSPPTHKTSTDTTSSSSSSKASSNSEKKNKNKKKTTTTNATRNHGSADVSSSTVEMATKTPTSKTTINVASSTVLKLKGAASTTSSSSSSSSSGSLKRRPLEP